MRFDEFVEKHAVPVSPVDRFAGLVVEIGVPPGWEPFDSAPGVHVWFCRDDPRIDDFCANAVLTMHRIDAVLDALEVFTMLVEQQLQSTPSCHEIQREFAAATDGPGAVGELAMHIAHDRGTIDSRSRSRIITTERETLIAQLTVTALDDSPVDRANVWLTVRTGVALGSVTIGHRRGVPVTTTRDQH
jgi:hypothetical protein